MKAKWWVSFSQVIVVVPSKKVGSTFCFGIFFFWYCLETVVHSMYFDLPLLVPSDTVAFLSIWIKGLVACFSYLEVVEVVVVMGPELTSKCYSSSGGGSKCFQQVEFQLFNWLQSNNWGVFLQCFTPRLLENNKFFCLLMNMESYIFLWFESSEL